jgi:hypothetical protein
MAGIGFSGFQNDEKLHIGSPHCQAIKRPNRGSVNTMDGGTNAP